MRIPLTKEIDEILAGCLHTGILEPQHLQALATFVGFSSLPLLRSERVGRDMGNLFLKIRSNIYLTERDLGRIRDFLFCLNHCPDLSEKRAKNEKKQQKNIEKTAEIWQN